MRPGRKIPERHQSAAAGRAGWPAKWPPMAHTPTSAISARLLAVTMLAQPFRYAVASLPTTSLQTQRHLRQFFDRTRDNCGFLAPMTVLPKTSNPAAAIALMSKEQSSSPFSTKNVPFSFCPSHPLNHRYRACVIRRMCGGAGEAATNERTDEEKERLKAEREQRKAAKEAEAAAKKARKEAEARAKEWAAQAGRLQSQVRAERRGPVRGAGKGGPARPLGRYV